MELYNCTQTKLHKRLQLQTTQAAISLRYEHEKIRKHEATQSFIAIDIAMLVRTSTKTTFLLYSMRNLKETYGVLSWSCLWSCDVHWLEGLPCLLSLFKKWFNSLVKRILLWWQNIKTILSLKVDSWDEKSYLSFLSCSPSFSVYLTKTFLTLRLSYFDEWILQTKVTKPWVRRP